MRIFDEMAAITHSRRLMQPRMILFLALAACLPFEAMAQPQTDTNQTQTAQTQTDTNLTQTAQAPPAPARKERLVSLQDCLQLALQHNLDIQIQRYDPIVSQYTLDVSYDTYEPVFNLTAEKSYNASPGTLFTSTNGPPIPIPGNQTESDTYAPQITGTLPTGLQYTLLSGNPWSRNSVWSTNGGGYWLPPTWSSGPGITLSQPLLRNLWIDQARLTIQLNKAALKISEQALRLQIMTSITQVKTAYYNLIFARGNVDANATALKLAEELAAEDTKRVQIGTLAPLDQAQAESQAAASLAALEAAKQALITQENTLKNLLTDNYMEWADVTPKPAEDLVAVPQLLDRQTSWRRALAERPELIEAQLKAKQQSITLKYDFNQVFPQLDVIGSYGRNAFDDSLGDNLTDLSRGDASYYSVGASVSIPLGGNFSARNNYKSAKATLKQVLLQLKQQEQTILVAVDNDIGQVQSDLEQVNATHSARLYAEDALKAEQTKLANGKSTSFNVLQLISNLTTARVNEIQALANYNIAQAQLSLDEGSTIEDNHIDLRMK
jgi:outer membrane protein TolC